jgi:hypothetical protein
VELYESLCRLVVARCSALAQCHILAHDEKERRVTLRNRKKEIVHKSGELGALSSSRIDAILSCDQAAKSNGSKSCDYVAAVGLLCDALGELVISELPCSLDELNSR